MVASCPPYLHEAVRSCIASSLSESAEGVARFKGSRGVWRRRKIVARGSDGGGVTNGES